MKWAGWASCGLLYCLIRSRLTPTPLIDRITHCQTGGFPEPCHEGAVEFETVPAFSLEEPSDVLRVPVAVRDGGGARDAAAVPVERCHSRLHRAAGSGAEALSSDQPANQFDCSTRESGAS
jgi:hypothetical protein